MRRRLITKADTGTRANIQKAYEIRDAEISFVSLVKKAANKHTFLITKSDDDGADFEVYGKIVCSEAEAEVHYVTGIVYEPMAEDTQGNYMTEEEIVKAAHWFAKNGNQVDFQHNFKALEGATVVESSVTKCDMELGGQTIKKGTWLMTVEITDPDVNEKIAKGEITGFSMGGHGKYSTVDVDIESGEPVSKSEEEPETRNILKAIAERLGVIKKGKVTDNYHARTISDNFWSAFYALQDVLMYSYNADTDRWERQTDETTIRAALQEFSDIVTGILVSDDAVFKSAEGMAESFAPAEIKKAGKSISEKNMSTLKTIHENLGSFLKQFEPEEQEETDVKKSEVEAIVKAAIAKAFGTDDAANAHETNGEGANPAPAAEGGETPADAELTPEIVEKMVSEAIVKAAAEKLAGAGAATPAETDPELTAESVAKMVNEAVAKAMEPVLKSTGLPTNLNGAAEKEVEKSGEHYLHGIL